MNLLTRKCHHCDSRFDIINDKYFTKRNNEKLFTVLNIIFAPVLRGSYLKPKTILICECCHRNDKIKKLGI